MTSKLNETPMFSINEYDYEGDVHEYGVYLHFGDTRIKVAKDATGFDRFVEHLDGMRTEIRENY